ncbi:MAG: flagellar filament capping protein FliD [bacterium]
MATGINFNGLASGLDTESIITKLMQLEKVPIQRLTKQQTDLTNQLSAMQQFQSRVNNLQASLGALTNTTAFSSVTVSSSKTEVATVATTSTAQQGTYSLKVSQLAQSQKISSKAYNNSTSALNLTGSIVVNNKAITVTATDTLATVAGKINTANVGVVASILNGGENSTYLTLTAKDSGIANKVGIADVGSGNVLNQLGLLSGVESVRESITNGMASFDFTSQTTAIGSMLGLSASPTGTITVNGLDVTIDLATDTLLTVADKIMAADPTVTATVTSTTTNGTTKYSLELVGAASQPTLTDNNNILKVMGLTQFNPGDELLAAKDALFSIDNHSFSRSSNSITDVISGVTVNLVKANLTTPEESTITMSKDITTMKNNVNNFVTAFNNFVDFVDANSKLDAATFETGAFFGNYVTSSIRDSVIGDATNIVSGLSGTLDTLTEIGITLDSSNKLSVDNSKLTEALNGDVSAISALFQSVGTPSTTDLRYISSTSKTTVNITGYEVNISQLATKALVSGTQAYTSPLPIGETEMLTFSGVPFGSSSINILLTGGQTLDQAVAQINADTRLNSQLQASNVGGILTFTAVKYGSQGNFSVVSDKDALGYSGVGKTAILGTGLNVKGTLDGGTEIEGLGQFLTGATDTDAEGLQVMVTGTTLGSYGTVKFTRGIAQNISDYLQGVSDSATGDISAYNKSIQDQIDYLTTRMTEMQALTADREIALRAKFSALEDTISRMNSQSSQLTAMWNGIAANK